MASNHTAPQLTRLESPPWDGDEAKAASKIQALARGQLVRKQQKDQRLWEAWNQLDMKEEQELMQSHQTYEDLKATLKRKKSLEGPESKPQSPTTGSAAAVTAAGGFQAKFSTPAVTTGTTVIIATNNAAKPPNEEKKPETPPVTATPTQSTSPITTAPSSPKTFVIRTKTMAAATTASPTTGSPKPAQSTSTTSSTPSGPPKEDDGLTLTDPIQLDFVTAMMDHFKFSKKLDLENVVEILRRTKAVLKAQPNVVHLNVTTRLTVVGDLHGQLDDLLAIFKLNGLPSPRNAYIFNGDFVDRGIYSCECVLTLFAFKLLYPKSMHLNRGNHEARDINGRDGFEKECLQKYNYAVFDLFSDVFACLPLAAVINKEIFVVHGGLSNQDFTIEQLNAVERFHEIPPSDSLMEDIMWSDPDKKNGRRSSARGAGLSFGPDVTARFLQANNVRMIIRSHECMQKGFEMHHGDTMITVFSASNYCFGTDTRVLTNKGFLFLSDLEEMEKRGELESVQYACYDVKKKVIVYAVGELIRPENRFGHLINFTAPDDADSNNNGLSLRVTPGHDIYVQHGESADGSNEVKWSTDPMQKVQSQQLLSNSSSQHIRMLSIAEHGVQRTTLQTPNYLHALELTHPDAEAAFLELYGCWIINPPTQTSESTSICFPYSTDVDALMQRMDLQEGRDWCRSCQSTTQIVNPSWIAYFHTQSPSSSLSSFLTQLDLPRLRHLLNGMSHASGLTPNTIRASTSQLRDQLIVAALHAGYTAHATIAVAQSHESLALKTEWHVHYQEQQSSNSPATTTTTNTHSLTMPQLPCSLIMRDAYNDRIWCIRVAHSDHILMAQRAIIDEVSGIVQHTSRPVFVGNCGTVNNEGSFIIFERDLIPRIVPFFAKPKERLSRYRMRHAVMENDIISKLLQRIADNRLALTNWYRQVETLTPAGIRTITRAQWAEGLKSVLKLNIPFMEFQDYLGLPKLGVDGRKKGDIDCMAFLLRFRPVNALLENSVKQLAAGDVNGHAQHTVSENVEAIVEMLQKNKYELESLFRHFDLNGDETLSTSEFKEGICSLQHILGYEFTESDVDELIAFIDKNGDGHISYGEWTRGFQIQDPLLREVQKKNAAAKALKIQTGSGIPPPHTPSPVITPRTLKEQRELKDTP